VNKHPRSHESNASPHELPRLLVEVLTVLMLLLAAYHWCPDHKSIACSPSTSSYGVRADIRQRSLGVDESCNTSRHASFDLPRQSYQID
jgi:hypothetical protein